MAFLTKFERLFAGSGQQCVSALLEIVARSRVPRERIDAATALLSLPAVRSQIGPVSGDVLQHLLEEEREIEAAAKVPYGGGR